jgi:hypothetical protein
LPTDEECERPLAGLGLSGKLGKFARMGEVMRRGEWGESGA